MVVLVPPALLLLFSLLNFAFHLRKIKPSFIWLVSAASASAAVLFLFLMYPRIPLSSSFGTWQPAETFPYSFQFLLDDFSWPFSASLTILCLAGLMVSLVNQVTLSPTGKGWQEWLGITTVSGISLLSVISGDLLTLVTIWTALDFIEFGFWLRAGDAVQSLRKPLFLLTNRLAGTMLVVWAALLSIAGRYPLALPSLHASVLPLLLIAAVIRSSILPPIILDSTHFSSRSILGVLLLLAPQTTNMMILVRIAALPHNTIGMGWMVFIALVTFFCSLAWSAASAENLARGYWLVAVSGLALAASNQVLPGASLGWGIALFLAGSLLMMASLQVKGLSPLLVLGGVSISSLPFSLTWQGVKLYNSPFTVVSWIFLASQALLLAGYIRFALIKRQALDSSETWKPGMYFFSLVLLLGMVFVIYLLSPVISSRASQPTFLQTWPAFLITGLCLVGLAVSRRFKIRIPGLAGLFSFLSASELLARIGNLLFVSFSRVFAALSFVLEGRAGVLWAFLICILLISLMSQLGAGG